MEIMKIGEKNVDYLTGDEALNTIRELSMSQGRYSRMYLGIMSDKKAKKEFYKYVKKGKFKDKVDFIMDLES